MSRYFLLGNFWVLCALIILIGGKVERTQPTLVSFFGAGAWFYPTSYNLIVAVAGVMAFFCFVMAARERPNRPNSALRF